MFCKYSSLILTRLVAVLVGFAITGCEKSHQSSSQRKTGDRHLEVVLRQSSSAPTWEEVAPYEDALMVNEYEVVKVLNGGVMNQKIIRVAQWALVNKEPLSLSLKMGARRDLWVTNLDNMPELRSSYQRDDLPFEPDVSLYYDLSPLPEASALPKNIRYDYRYTLSATMRVYWLIRQQLKLVVIGNSHTSNAVDPKQFYLPENKESPVAMNICATGSGSDFQCLIANQYLQGLPKLKWVVWGVSPRIFNANFVDDQRTSLFVKSPGFLYDQQHKRELVNTEQVTKLVTVQQIRKIMGSEIQPWGGVLRKHRLLPVPLTPDSRKKILHQCAERNYLWNADAWEQFQETVESLAKQNVRVLLFVPPYHPLVAQSNNADADGTGNQDYKEMVERMRALSEGNAKIHFLDIHDGGKHEFKHEDFSDISHLFGSGALKLTGKLVDFIDEIENHELR